MHSVASLNLRRNESNPTASQLPRRASFTFPERFKDGEDADTDVTAPSSKRQRYINQSFLSMIANVGSNIPPEPQAGLESGEPALDSSEDGAQTVPMAQSVAGLGIPSSSRHAYAGLSSSTSRSGKSRMIQSTSGLGALRERKKKSARRSRLASLEEDMSSSQILPPRPSQQVAEETAEEETGTGPEHQVVSSTEGGDGQNDGQDDTSSDASQEMSDAEGPPPPTDLATRVAEVFGLRQPEDIITEMPCWLVQNIVVNGRLYVTPEHVCFYAFLPRKTGSTAKSGFFFKRGPRNPRYHRYWFILRGNVLSYYQSASSLYFPQGTIDLRSAVSAQLETASDDGTGKGFNVTTSKTVHRFKAESVASAQEWVKKIQQAIFHSHNVGNSVKVCLPIRNMLEVDDNPLFERWETLKIKIVDEEDTFAIDEYFFSFMNHDNSALDLLRRTIAQDQSHQQLAGRQRRSSARDDGFEEEPLTSTKLLVKPGSTSSSAFSRPSKPSKSRTFSADSFDEVAESSAAETSESESVDPVSASRILRGSDVFHQSRFGTRIPEPTEAFLQQRDRRDDSRRLADSASTIQPSASSSRLDTFVQASNASLQKAAGLADILRTKSKRVSDVLASESRTYYEKVTNMWSGKTVHFDENENSLSASNMDDSEVRNPDASAGDRFRGYFALSEHEKLEATYHGFLLSGLPIYGKLYLGNRKLCFRALVPGMRTKMVLPIRDIITIDKVKGLNLGYSGLVIVVRGHEELFLEFGYPEARDDLAVTLQKRLSNVKEMEDSRVMTEEDAKALEHAQKEFDSLEEARSQKSRTYEEMFESIAIDDEEGPSPVIFDDIEASIIDFKPPKSLRVVCLTIGSRGDVQPYIALCKGLKADGHRPLIATHQEFESWIRKHGIDFAPVAGDPAEIMQLCVENDMFTINFFKEVATKMHPWFDALLETSWKACQGADVLIESPSAMAGIHIAQALEIPYFRAFSMLWTRTRAYPHPFVVPKQKLGGNYNYLSYVIVDKFLWQASAYQVNRWRVKSLGLPPTSLERLKLNSVPFLYNFSSHVVARPLDFSPWVHVTGNWFLDESSGYEPPEELADFIDRARGDGKKLVYVGFGSMVVENRAAMTKTIVDSVLKADVRCVFSKGWSDRLQGPYDSAEIRIPSELIVIKSAPHDWLFKEVDAAVHHGGAGTTAASLRAGLPTIVKPFFGDQKFYGARVEDLGVGRCLDKFNTSVFSRALWEVTHNERIIEKARALGEQMRSEDGVDNAVQTIYRDLEYAKSLIKHQKGVQGASAEDEDDGSVQGWTLVDDEFEAEE